MIWGILGIVLCLILTSLRFVNPDRLRYHTTFIKYGVCIIVASFMGAVYALSNPRNFQLWFAMKIGKILGDYALGIKFIIRNGHNLDHDRAAVVICNHQSTLDVYASCCTMYKKKITAIVKKELIYVPVVGVCAWIFGFIFIDRKKPKEAIKTISNKMKLIEKEKMKLFIFPEGTRSDGQKILPFKKGAFFLAIQMKQPIIPVVISPYHFIDYEKKTLKKGGRLIISVLNEVPTAHLNESDVESLKDEVYGLMQAEFEKLSAEVRQFSEESEKSIQPNHIQMTKANGESLSHLL